MADRLLEKFVALKGASMLSLVMITSRDNDSCPLRVLHEKPNSFQSTLLPPAKLFAQPVPTTDLFVVDSETDETDLKQIGRFITQQFPKTPAMLCVEADKIQRAHYGIYFHDFIIHTIRPAEFMARYFIVKERLRSMQANVELQPIYIDQTLYKAFVRGQETDLTFMEFSLLQFFIHHPREAFSREQLAKKVWGDPETYLRTIDVHIARLRSKLGDDASAIETVRGLGYRFVQPDFVGKA